MWFKPSRKDVVELTVVFLALLSNLAMITSALTAMSLSLILCLIIAIFSSIFRPRVSLSFLMALNLGLPASAEVSQGPPKRAAVGATEKDLSKHVETLSKLSLQAAMNARFLAGTIFET